MSSGGGARQAHTWLDHRSTNRRACRQPRRYRPGAADNRGGRKPVMVERSTRWPPGCCRLRWVRPQRRSPMILDGRKVYRFSVRWGEARDTDDAEGRGDRDQRCAPDTGPDRSRRSATLSAKSSRFRRRTRRSRSRGSALTRLPAPTTPSRCHRRGRSYWSRCWSLRRCPIPDHSRIRGALRQRYLYPRPGS